LGGDEAGGDDDGRFSGGGERVDDVLEKEEVDGHLVFRGLGDVGEAGEEAVFVFLGVELIAPVGEVEF